MVFAILGCIWARVAYPQAATIPPDLTTTIDASKPLVWEAPPQDQRVLPATPDAPQQVNVSVKVVEFQTNKGVETGLSAYFARRNEPRPYGRISSGNGNVTAADITFPTSGAPNITVFFDRIRLSEGDIEAVLQALVNENRLFIHSRPKAMVMVGSTVPTLIKTVKEVPYEETSVVGATTVQATKFRPTGVSLKIAAPQVIDDDGNWATTEDTYIMLNIDAEVTEEGDRIVIALADQAGGTANQISVPELVSRSVQTSVWVRHGQVLMLGGLYRNTKNKNLSTLPWLLQAEDLAVGLAEQVVPGNFLASPLSTSVGNRSTSEGRRELVFLLKAEIWQPAYTVAEEQGFVEEGDQKERAHPTDVISDVIQGITSIPQGIAEGVSKKDESKAKGKGKKPEAEGDTKTEGKR